MLISLSRDCVSSDFFNKSYNSEHRNQNTSSTAYCAFAYTYTPCLHTYTRPSVCPSQNGDSNLAEVISNKNMQLGN